MRYSLAWSVQKLINNLQLWPVRQRHHTGQVKMSDLTYDGQRNITEWEIPDMKMTDQIQRVDNAGPWTLKDQIWWPDIAGPDNDGPIVHRCVRLFVQMVRVVSTLGMWTRWWHHTSMIHWEFDDILSFRILRYVLIISLYCPTPTFFCNKRSLSVVEFLLISACHGFSERFHIIWYKCPLQFYNAFLCCRLIYYGYVQLATTVSWSFKSVELHGHCPVLVNQLWTVDVQTCWATCVDTASALYLGAVAALQALET